MLTRRFSVESEFPTRRSSDADLSSQMGEGALSARDLLVRYCAMLYDKFGTYEEVSRRTQLDRRTVKKYIGQWNEKTAKTA